MAQVSIIAKAIVELVKLARLIYDGIISFKNDKIIKDRQEANQEIDEITGQILEETDEETLAALHRRLNSK